MATFERMTISLPEPMAAALRASVAAGSYTSTNEAIQDAVRVWSGQRDTVDRETTVLRDAWDAGKASGLHGNLDFDELHREARSELSAAVKAAGRADRGRLVEPRAPQSD